MSTRFDLSTEGSGPKNTLISTILYTMHTRIAESIYVGPYRRA